MPAVPLFTRLPFCRYYGGMIRAIALDFDGVILDTETPLIDAYSEVYRKRNMPFDRARFERHVGTSDASFEPWKAFGEAAPRGELEAELQRRYAERMEQQQIMPGVVELIGEIRQRGLLLGMASNSLREHVIGHLKRFGLFENFDYLVCGEDAAAPKPAPYLYLVLVEKFKVRYDEVLAIEDSASGIASARAAGLWCLAVPSESTREHDFSRAHHRVESLAGQTLNALLAGLRMGARGGKP